MHYRQVLYSIMFSGPTIFQFVIVNIDFRYFNFSRTTGPGPSYTQAWLKAPIVEDDAFLIQTKGQAPFQGEINT